MAVRNTESSWAVIAGKPVSSVKRNLESKGFAPIKIPGLNERNTVNLQFELFFLFPCRCYLWKTKCARMIGFMSQNCAKTCRFCPGDEFNAGMRVDTDKFALLVNTFLLISLNYVRQ